MSITTGSSAITFTYETGGCPHDFTLPLYCGWATEPGHGDHLAGYACRLCNKQAFYAGPWCDKEDVDAIFWTLRDGPQAPDVAYDEDDDL